MIRAVLLAGAGSVRIAGGQLEALLHGLESDATKGVEIMLVRQDHGTDTVDLARARLLCLDERLERFRADNLDFIREMRKAQSVDRSDALKNSRAPEPLVRRPVVARIAGQDIRRFIPRRT